MTTRPRKPRTVAGKARPRGDGSNPQTAGLGARAKSAAPGRSRAAEPELAGTCVSIEKLVPGGAGLGRLPDGRVLFAQGTAPGDEIRVVLATRGGRLVHAERFELVKASGERTTPPCAVHQECGGCDWMHLGVSAQRTQKLSLVTEALRRTGKLDKAPERMIPGSSDVGYRSRARFQITPDGRLGFFAAKTHQVVEIPECVVCVPALNEALGALRAVVGQHSGALAPFCAVEVSAPTGENQVGLHFWPLETHEAPGVACPYGPQTEAALCELNQAFAVTVRGERGPKKESSGARQSAASPESGGAEQAAPGETPARWKVTNTLTLRVPPGGFTQINWEINQKLVAHIRGWVQACSQEDPIKTVLDVYSGAGNFALPLAQDGLSVVGIEAHRAAVQAARFAARDAGISVTLRVATAEAGMKRCIQRKEAYDAVLLDPPRAGAKEVLSSLFELAPKHVAIVACDPVTLARDLRTLTNRPESRGAPSDAGQTSVPAGPVAYELKSLTLFDMFPHTHHVESVAFLRRRKNS